jgi:hypothetical protein
MEAQTCRMLCSGKSRMGKKKSDRSKTADAPFASGGATSA